MSAPIARSIHSLAILGDPPIGRELLRPLAARRATYRASIPILSEFFHRAILLIALPPDKPRCPLSRPVSQAYNTRPTR